MRQAQNSKRVRGRGRKMVNQLNRTMDSSGPDVKIRGTPSHIFEKYQALARDANSSGDRISAENYLQHAEHYFRLINAMQAQAQGANGQAQPGFRPANGMRAGEQGETFPEDGPQPIVTPPPGETPEMGEEQPPVTAETGQSQGQRPGRGPGRGPRGRRRGPNGPGNGSGNGETKSHRAPASESEGQGQFALADQDGGLSESQVP